MKTKSQASLYQIISSLVAVPTWGRPRELCDFCKVSEVDNLVTVCSSYEHAMDPYNGVNGAHNTPVLHRSAAVALGALAADHVIKPVGSIF